MCKSDKEKFMKAAVGEALKAIRNNEGGPFGCVIVKNGEIIGRGHNKVTSTNDPTAHAEIIAIRNACKHLGYFQLDGCEIYTSCEPCPMCLGAIYWARPDKVYYGNMQSDAAKVGFDDEFIYQEIEISPENRKIPFIQFGRNIALASFKEWEDKEDKIEY